MNNVTSYNRNAKFSYKTILNVWHRKAVKGEITVKDLAGWDKPFSIARFKINNSNYESTIQHIHELMRFELELVKIIFNWLSHYEEKQSWEWAKNLSNVKESSDKLNNIKKLSKVCDLELSKLEKKFYEIASTISTPRFKLLSKEQQLTFDHTLCKVIPLACALPIVFKKENSVINSWVKNNIINRVDYCYKQNNKYILFLNQLEYVIKRSNNDMCPFNNIYKLMLPYPSWRPGIGLYLFPIFFRAAITLKKQSKQEPNRTHVPAFIVVHTTNASKDFFNDPFESNHTGSDLPALALSVLIEGRASNFNWLLQEQEYDRALNALLFKSNGQENLNDDDLLDIDLVHDVVSMMSECDQKMISLTLPFWKDILAITEIQKKISHLLNAFNITVEADSSPQSLLTQIKHEDNEEIRYFTQLFKFDLEKKWLMENMHYDFSSKIARYAENMQQIARLYLSIMNLQRMVEKNFYLSRKLIYKFSEISASLENFQYINSNQITFLFMKGSIFTSLLYRYAEMLCTKPFLPLEKAFLKEPLEIQLIAHEAIDILSDPQPYFIQMDNTVARFTELKKTKNQNTINRLIRRDQKIIELFKTEMKNVSEIINPQERQIIKENAKQVIKLVSRTKTSDQIEEAKREEEINQMKMDEELKLSFLKLAEKEKQKKESNKVKIKKNIVSNNKTNSHAYHHQRASSDFSPEKPSLDIFENGAKTQIIQNENKKEISFIKKIENISPIILGDYPKAWQDIERDAEAIQNRFKAKYSSMTFTNKKEMELFLFKEKARHDLPTWLSKLATQSSYCYTTTSPIQKSRILFGAMQFEDGEITYGVFEWVSFVSKTGENPVYKRPHHCYFNNLSNSPYFRPSEVTNMLNSCQKNNLAKKFDELNITDTTICEDDTISIDINGYLKIEDSVNKCSMIIVPLKFILDEF